MKFNAQINYLKKYFEEKAAESLEVMPRAIYEGAIFALSMRMDTEYASFKAFRNDVMKCAGSSYSITMRSAPKNDAQLEQRKRILAEMKNKIKSLSEKDACENYPYERVIYGEEYELLAKRFLDVWGYTPRYWYPVDNGGSIESLVLMWDAAEPYFEKINGLIGSGSKRFYRMSEEDFLYVFPLCRQMDFIIPYEGAEHVYTDEDFTWLIYFSHEKTVTFGGSIVPGIKKLLEDIKDKWDVVDIWI